MKASDRRWKQIVKLDKEIDQIESCPMFSQRKAEYDQKVDDWVLLADQLGTDADGVKIRRGKGPATLHQRVLF